MLYECIKEFPPTGSIPGDELNVEKQANGEYLIDAAGILTGDILYKHFRKKRLRGYKYAPYSFSKMDTWLSCPKKFEFNYIIKPERTFEPSPILEKGTLFHSILEHAIVNKLHEYEPDFELEALDETAQEEIVMNALEFTQKSKIWKKIYNLEGEKIPEIEIFLGDKLQPIEDKYQSLIKGFVDLLIVDEENKKIYIYDWKTGGKSIEQLKKWPRKKDQLELYALWALEMFGYESATVGYVYVELDYVAEYTITQKQVSSIKNKFKHNIDMIENDKSFIKNKTKLCDWCDFQELCNTNRSSKTTIDEDGNIKRSAPSILDRLKNKSKV